MAISASSPAAADGQNQANPAAAAADDEDVASAVAAVVDAAAADADADDLPQLQIDFEAGGDAAPIAGSSGLQQQTAHDSDNSESEIIDKNTDQLDYRDVCKFTH